MKLKAKKSAPLLEVLQDHFPDSSKAILRLWIKQGRIVQEQTPLKHTHAPIPENAILNFQDKFKYIDYGIKIFYEDRYLVVVEKPAGLLSVATDYETKQTVHAALKKRGFSKRVFPVHRLDQKTSGVMVFAYTQHSKEGLKKQFHTHAMERQYLALVEGTLRGEGTWKSLLKEDAHFFVSSHPDGKEAITHYKVIQNLKHYAALQLTLETGRKNQIRVHASEAGFPVVGDEKYGATTNPLKRLGLHAYLLCFTHPITKKKMKFKSLAPLPFIKYFKRFV